MAVVLAFAMITFCVCTLIKVLLTQEETYEYGMHPEPIAVFEETVEMNEIEVQTVSFEQEAPLISEDELMAKVIMAEAGSEKFAGKVAVAIAILNRSDYYEQTIYEVLTAPNQFASPAYIVTEDCYKAVEFAKENRDLFPEDMIYFRNKYYHKNLGVPYIQIGGHFFSTVEEHEITEKGEQ
jgi:hypothetical protein